MDDLISRQDVINAIDVLKRNYPSSCFEDLCEAVDIAIKALSAQPEPEQNNDVGCNGCRHDWLGDPRCAKCARSFQDYYEAEMGNEG